MKDQTISVLEEGYSAPGDSHVSIPGSCGEQTWVEQKEQEGEVRAGQGLNHTGSREASKDPSKTLGRGKSVGRIEEVSDYEFDLASS